MPQSKNFYFAKILRRNNKNEIRLNFFNNTLVLYKYNKTFRASRIRNNYDSVQIQSESKVGSAHQIDVRTNYNLIYFCFVINNENTY